MISEVAKLKSDLVAANRVGLALDIDNTLSQSRIIYFNELIEKIGTPENLTATELMAKYTYTRDVSYWQTEEARALMEKLVVDEESHSTLELISGADDSIREISKLVPIVAYITARPEVLSRITYEWLKKHNLPEAPVILRPQYVLDEQAWKAEVLEFLYPQVTGIVDDHPVLPDKLSLDYKGTVYVYASPYPGREGLDIVHCTDWASVASEVKKRHQQNS